MTTWRGQFTDDYFAQPAPDPARFGMPTDDDGSRDDPLLSDRSSAVTSYRPDVDALTAAPTRIVIAVGEESENTFTGRTTVATAELLGQQVTVFPSHHGGFLGGESGYAGQPEAFARKLHDVLDRQLRPGTSGSACRRRQVRLDPRRDRTSGAGCRTCVVRRHRAPAGRPRQRR